MLILRPVDSVDASKVDTDLIGHSYYGDNTTVLSDLFCVLRGQPPDGRSRLRAFKRGDVPYWVFAP
jgi:hypothetical protein